MTSRRRSLRAVMLLTIIAGPVALGCGCSSEDAKGDGALGGGEGSVAEASAVTPRFVGPPAPLKRIFARRFVGKIREAPRRDAYRVGYLRAGSVLKATTAEPVGYEGCRGGWYELSTGGFVCNRRHVIAFYGRRLPERRARQPDREARLPYPYAYNRRPGTPVYRRLPSAEEVALHEGPGPGAAQGGADSAAQADGGVPTAVLDKTQFVRGAGGVSSQAARGAKRSGVTRGDAGVASRAGGFRDERHSADAGAGEAEQAQDAGPPTLESLEGDPDGLVRRRMVRGFYVSLDREMERDGRRYWRTQSNGFIPASRLRQVEGSAFEGAELRELGWELPIAYVLSGRTRSYTKTERGRLRRAGQPGYHHVLRVAGEEQVRGRRYLISDEGLYYRAARVTRIDAREPPEEVAPGEKWIDVDLARQSLVAYEGSEPVFATLISSGRVKDEDDPLRNFATPTGSFRILSKHLTHTMDGDHAVDGPYSIEDVPYVMYFQLAYALHSAFWHNVFGRPRSHGCVNMAPEDAKWLFEWSDPQLPEGWHTAYPSKGKDGTRLYIHGETP